MVTVQTSEQGAKECWARFVRAGGLATVEGSAALFVASDELASVVAALLREQGLPVKLDHLSVAPAYDDRAEVAALELVCGGESVVVPIIPARAELLLYPLPAAGAELGGSVATVTVPAGHVESGGWVPAAAIAEQLRAAAVEQ